MDESAIQKVPATMVPPIERDVLQDCFLPKSATCMLSCSLSHTPCNLPFFISTPRNHHLQLYSATLTQLPFVLFVPPSQCMTGCIAAVTTLGGVPLEGQQRVDYMGNSNVVEQAGILGVERIILVTR